MTLFIYLMITWLFRLIRKYNVSWSLWRYHIFVSYFQRYKIIAVMHLIAPGSLNFDNLKTCANNWQVVFKCNTLQDRIQCISMVSQEENQRRHTRTVYLQIPVTANSEKISTDDSNPLVLIRAVKSVDWGLCYYDNAWWSPYIYMLS